MNADRHLLIPGFLRIVLILIIGFSISGCYSINRYGVSADNVYKMKQLQSPPLAVEKFESSRPDLHSIFCRASALVSTPDDVSFESYIEQAFIDELKLAGAYDPKSTIVVHGRLEKVDFNTKPGNGKWSLKMAISSKTNPGFTVDSTYEFSANWMWMGACHQVAQTFVPAVQQLISKAISDPRFKQLAL